MGRMGYGSIPSRLLPMTNALVSNKSHRSYTSHRSHLPPHPQSIPTASTLLLIQNPQSAIRNLHGRSVFCNWTSICFVVGSFAASLLIFWHACNTVVWSFPPNAFPTSFSDKLGISILHRYIAT